MKKALFFFILLTSLVTFAQFPENFENSAILNNATPPASGWSTFTNGIVATDVPSNNWRKTNLQFRGAYSARVSQQTGIANETASLQWLVSPQVAKPVNGQVRFYTRKGQSDDYGATYTVRYSTSPTINPADFIIIGTWNESQISSTAWEQKFVPIPAIVPTGQNIYIAFVKQNVGGDTWFVDDIKVDSQCLAPTTLAATPLATSASLSWTSPNPAGPWQIEYGSGVFTPGATPSQGTVLNVSTNPYNLTGLTSMTGYTFYVRTMCDTDNPSPWSNSANFTTTASPPECGGNFIDFGGATANYPNNENRTWTITPANPNEIVTVTFTSFNTEDNWDALYVYDGPTTAAPLISSGNPSGNVPGGIPGGYWGTTIPGPFTSSHPSGALTFVFRSDGLTNRAGWIANITCSTCPPPARINLVTASSNSLQVSWIGLAPLATSYEVICLPTGSPAPTVTSTGQTTTMNPYVINGLNSNTTYDVYVRPICTSTSTTGIWSVKGTFSTLPNYCGGDILYDSGGATGSYSNNENRTFTICPPNTGEVVTVYFNSFNISDDTLKIYDGNSIAAPLIGTFTGYVILPSIAASNTNTSGCLTFVFTSNANGTAQGWDANVVCGPACPTITAILDTVNSTPLVNGKMNVCKNQNVQFAGTATALSGGGNISINGATYKWLFDDGVVLNGQNVSRSFTNSGVYEVNLIVTLPGGCRSVNKIRQIINVSTDPVFTHTISDSDICTNQTSILSVAHTMVTASQVCVPNVTGITRFLPDRVAGSPPVESVSEITIQECYTGRTITSASDIESICMNIEHSFLSDLTIELIAPNGVSVFLSNRNGGSANLGIPWATATVDGQSSVLTPGIGYDYCFNSTGATTMAGSAPPTIAFPSGNGPGTYNDTSIRQSVLPSTNIYKPEGNFNSFIGSPIEGTWKLRIIDYVGSDNGYLFGWNMKFSPAIPTTSNQFTPVFASGSWSPSPDIITPLNSSQITVRPTTSGTKCYTYNLTNDFGCTYSHEVCIDVIQGVTLTANTANPVSVYVGQNGTYYFTGGSPNAIVTYNINGGANQQITLDASGNATVVLNNLTVNTTVTATNVAQQPIPTSGNVISTTSLNSTTTTNSIGPILPVGTIASNTNSTLINNTSPTATFQFTHQLPIGTVVTISIARNSLTSSCLISDGATPVNTLTFNSGGTTAIQHIQFVVGRVTNSIIITQNSGTIYVDGMSYTFNMLGCDAPLNLPATVTVTQPPFPYITSITSPSNICLGNNAVFEIVGSLNTTVFYSINGGATQSILLNNSGLGTLTVNSPTSDVTLTLSQLQMGVETATSSLVKTIVVNPLGQVNNINDQQLCHGAATSPIVFSTSNLLGTTTYTWTNNNTAIGLAASSNGNVTGLPSFTALNNTILPISATITVTPTYTNGGTSCVGNPISFTITVNPTPQITNKTSSICSGDIFSIAPVNGASSDLLAAGTTYSWTVVDNPNVTGESAQIDQILISQQLENLTTSSQLVTYTITPKGSNGCIGNPFTLVVTVNPEPVVSNQTVSTCSDVALNYNLDSLISGAGDTYSYTVISSNSTNVPPAGPRTVASAVNITDVYTNTTSSPVTITYTITPISSSGCIGNPFTLVVTVNPEPVVSNQTVSTCSDVALNYDLDSLIGGSGDLYTYTVTSSNSTNVPPAGPRTVASAANITDTYTNTTSSPVTITYTITPKGSNGCIGNPFTLVVTVNPEPVVSNQTVSTCSDVALNYDLDSLLAGSGDLYTYTVTSSNSTNVPPAGPRTVASAANITDTYTNTTSSPVTITYTITPKGSNGCIGNPFTLVVTVNPIATAIASPLSSNICTGQTFSTVLNSTTTGTSNVTYQWSASILNAPLGGSLTGFTSDNSGVNTIISQTLQNTGTSIGIVRYTVTPYIGLCPGTPINVDVTVNPLGQVDSVSNQFVCPGNATSTIVFATTNTGTTTYSWVNDTLNIGLAASGTSTTIPSFTAINTTTSPLVATITVTPTFSNGTTSCIGNPTSFTITVNPSPTLDLSSSISSTSQIICVNSPINPIQYTFGAGATGVNITGLPTGVNYAINGNIVTISGTPTTSSAAIFNYVITATGNACGSPNLLGTIEVTNGILPLFNQVAPVCQGATINIPTTSTNGIVGVWNLISSTANDVTYEFIPNPGQCALNTQMTIVVYPLPTVTPSVTSQSFCSGGTTNISLTSSVSNSAFYWTATGTSVTGQSGSVTGSGATSINQPLVLNPNVVSPGQVTYSIVAEANGCLGTPVTVVVTVNPIPNVIVSPVSLTQTICSSETTNISFSGAINNTVYSWSVVSSVGVSGALNGVGTSINQVLTTTGLSQGIVVYEVTPSLNGCIGTPQRITVTVNPVPVAIGPASHRELCSGEPTDITVSTFNAATVFNWTVESNGVSGASAGTATGLSINIAQPLTTTGNVRGYVDYSITPVLTACSGSPITVRVYVNPLPNVTLIDGTICVDAAGHTFQTYLLDSGLDDTNYDFVWFFEGNPKANSNHATHIADEVGVYSVVATNSTTNCVSPRVSATVTATNPATSFSITQSDYFSDNATIVVTVVGGNGTFMYQLDEGALQESNVFNGVTGGLHTITVIDIEGCTNLTQDVLVIDYPKYFTPNGDGYNDTWNIIGMNQQDAKLFIFDRYGKLIKQLTPAQNSNGWDGTYNGQPLPSTDYWFTLEYKENGTQKQFKAHFSLKR